VRPLTIDTLVRIFAALLHSDHHPETDTDMEHIRNIAIIAHVDPWQDDAR
jgi:hypothetical protein